MSVAEPPVSSAPARSRQATRARLIEAATGLFATRGLHSVTSAQIAHAAGVATGTFYLHFKDKHRLFHEIALAALADLRERQDRAAARCESGGPDEIRVRVEELVGFAADNRDLIRVVFGRGADSTDVAEAVIDEIVPDIEQRLAERRDRGEIAAALHPALAAQAIAAHNVRILGWWIDHPESATPSEVVDTLLALHPFRLHDSRS